MERELFSQKNPSIFSHGIICPWTITPRSRIEKVLMQYGKKHIPSESAKIPIETYLNWVDAEAVTSVTIAKIDNTPARSTPPAPMPASRRPPRC